MRSVRAMLDPRRFASDSTVALFGLYQTLIGAALLVCPHWFSAPIYRVWAVHPMPVGIAMILAGAVLLWIRVLPVRQPWLVSGGLGLTAVNFGGLAFALGRADALHGTVVYSAMAAAALVAVPAQLGGAADAKVRDGSPRDLFALTGGIVAVMTGALMIVLPDQYRAPAYDELRPHLTLLGFASLVVGGAVVVRWPTGNRQARSGRAPAFALCALFMVFAAGFAARSVWTGVLTYAVLTLGVVDLTIVRRWFGRVPTYRGLAASHVQRRAALIGATALVGSSLVLTILLTATSESRLRAEAADEDATFAASVSELVELYLDTHMAAVGMAAALPSITSMNPQLAEVALQQVRVNYPGFDNLSLLDRSGMQIARATPGAYVSLAAKPHVQRALGGERLVFGGVTPAVTNGEPIVVLGGAVRDSASDAVIGAVSASIRLPAITAFLGTASSAESRTIFVVGDDGLLIAHPDPAVLSSRQAPVIVSGEGSTIFERGGDRFLAGFSSVNGYGWTVVVEQPESAALAGVRRLRDRAYVLLILSSIVLVGLSALASHALLRQLVALIPPIRALGSGRYDTVLPLARDGEVGDLVRAFARMRHDLRDREQRLLEQNRELEAVSRLKSEFLSRMSHELRTPMNAIIGYAHLMLDGLDGELTEQQTADIGQIARSADHLLALINDVLDLSKIEAGHMELNTEPLDLQSIVTEVASTIRPQASAKGLELLLEIDPDVPAAEADAMRVRQILLNLASNAVKFTEHGRVSISVRQNEDRVEVVVTDTGIGIAAEAQEIVFDEFRQADGSTTRRFGGTGLGLAIARKLARMQGGEIELMSEPGRGSDFILSLPAAHSTPALAASPVPRLAPRAHVAEAVQADYDSSDLPTSSALPSH